MKCLFLAIRIRETLKFKVKFYRAASFSRWNLKKYLRASTINKPEAHSIINCKKIALVFTKKVVLPARASVEVQRHIKKYGAKLKIIKSNIYVNFPLMN
ncbi:hypothetical protein [Thermaurantimonas aggregans]|uniref:hypothetical protein n=1 Tax=Thermaurantimonas aggregans TaxID=2173829 RepID=UPI000F56B6C5|nr:hypothetical protein [Thermaurantimonas aggregans]MCX8147983.1 hypothetical protein [Thermaurantimonas aggregans]